MNSLVASLTGTGVAEQWRVLYQGGHGGQGVYDAYLRASCDTEVHAFILASFPG